MLAEKPVVCLLSGQPRAVDAALLPGTDAHSLSVLDVADGVRLRIFQRDQGNHQVSRGGFRQIPVFRHNVLQQRGVNFKVVVTLLKSHAEHVLALLLGRYIVRVNLHHVVLALFLGFQDLQRLIGIARGDDTVGDLRLQIGGCSRIAYVAQRSPVAVRAEPVGTAGTDIGAGNGGELCMFFHKVDLPVSLAQRQADGRTRRGNMLEACRRGQAGGLLQLFDQLPGIQCIQKVDITGTPVQHGDREFRTVLHVDFGRLLIRVAAVFQFKFFHISVPQIFIEEPDFAAHIGIKRDLVVRVQSFPDSFGFKLGRGLPGPS